MSGISRMIAKELSSALGIIDNPKYNPMFKQTEEALTDVADPSDPTVARFYSPLESAIDEAPIGKEGTRGENIEAFVRKRAPKVTQGEMEYRGLSGALVPSEKYRAEDVKFLIGDEMPIKAVKKGDTYRLQQRQSDLVDPEFDYVELSIESEDDLGLMTHFGTSNLAHSRYSVRKGESLPDKPGQNKYILIEELQSDPLQNIVDDLPSFEKKEKAVLDDMLKELFRDAETFIETEGSGYPDKALKDIKTYIYDVVIPARRDKSITLEERKELFKKGVEKVGLDPYTTYTGYNGGITEVVEKILSKEVDLNYSSAYEYEIGGFATDMYAEVENYLGKLEAATDKKSIPIQKLTDAIRLTLTGIISDAKSRNINQIVLPPVKKLAEKRFLKGDVDKRIAKGSAFHNTYVAAYNKVLKQLKAELGNQVEIGKKTLKYRADYAGKTFDEQQGTLLDISNLTIDPANIKLRFNKGGLVERRTK